MSLASVRIVEVGPRDGLQNIDTTVPLSTKLELIKKLHHTGLNTIELTSVVSPRAIPQLADCQALLSDTGIQRLLEDKRLRLPVLIPNLKGLQIAIQHHVQEIAVFVSASEGFSRANINCSVQQGLDRAKEVAKRAQNHGIAVRGYVNIVQCVSCLDTACRPTPFVGMTDPLLGTSHVFLPVHMTAQLLNLRF